ncbi:MAG: RdgB/HAM1 family non-canonical purine NTP pyrophosphatase [Actinomycetota bacterium]|nr:RdgB/HAM1 family non-canonical purine NTP pyrophosphatase [Euzebyaceae bacterium]MDQ3342394.1 RdgB/HAM1 family non-canonical purine NTP pyrophosphatase [Actinomycetota bacterium]MDQ3452091.1 RdgB/HAM1 family non-canonical purine NTP pyrophosphatase [Actinomycetota bacterium]
MTARLVLASRNQGKVAELRRILAADPALAGVRLLDADELGVPDVDETGATFADNALLKARSAVGACGLPCIADDSGLEVAALDGDPGVRSARYAGAHGDDDANLALVLQRMRGVTDRTARFVCVAALVAPDGGEWTAQGTVDGTLTETPRGKNGFGYDPIFQPAGQRQTTAEMTAPAKDVISHRSRALRATLPAVRRLLADQLLGDQSSPPMSTA